VNKVSERYFKKRLVTGLRDAARFASDFPMKYKNLTAKPQHTMTPSSNSKAPKEVMLQPTEPEVPRAAYSIPEFCEAHRICEAFYYKLRAAGLGPREMRMLRKVTISVEAAAEWRRARETAAR
jgi:hypothetical protein